MPDLQDAPPVSTPLRFLFGLIVVLGVLSIPVGGWYLYEYSSVAHWSGGYQLRIQIVSKRSMREVRCYTAFNRNEAEIAAHDPASWNELHDRIGPYLGSSLEVRVDTSGTMTRSGRDISHGQDRWLAVVAEFDDGTRVGKVVEIPDKAVSREVSLEIP